LQPPRLSVEVEGDSREEFPINSRHTHFAGSSYALDANTVAEDFPRHPRHVENGIVAVIQSFLMSLSGGNESRFRLRKTTIRLIYRSAISYLLRDELGVVPLRQRCFQIISHLG